MKDFFVSLFTASALVICVSAHSAEEGSIVNDSVALEEEISYHYPKPLSISPSFSFPSYVFSLSADGSEEQTKIIDYAPPPATEFTLRIAYGEIGVAWTRPLPQSSSSKRTYGKNSYNDWKAEFARDRFAIMGFLQTYQGFYTDLNGNTGNYARTSFGKGANTGGKNDFSSPITPSSSTQDILKRPDIRSSHLGLVTYYVWPLLDDTSQAFLLAFRANDEFTKPPEGWDLNALANLSFNKTHLNADSSLIPQKKENIFGSSSNLREIEMYSLVSAAGLASSYVFSGARTHIEGIFMFGVGAQRQLSVYGNDRVWKNAIANTTHLKFGVVRNGQRHAFSLFFSVDNWTTKSRNIRLNSSNMGLELGYSLKI